ncbi:uncharacterized protein LOC142168017 [Nicotiana tabacum]|uniref:Uncharacterized protein LOC142168017 n=1 Tax=Nicotiana tabacum TaxID=4097 RepID=A0AC58SII4_TOBAC
MAVEDSSSGLNAGIGLDTSSAPAADRVIPTVDQHHPLFLQPCDTQGSSLISIKLTGPENYALWSSSMQISLLGKSKLGFVDGRYPKSKFDPSLHDLWEKCNAIVLSWIMNYIASLSQGISYVSSYFSKLKELWAEFDALMPCPRCGCEESKKYAEHFESHRLLQFLMGLNESYAQSSNQIMIMSPTPTINKAYAMIISAESRRSLTTSTHTVDNQEKTLFSSGNNGAYNLCNIALFNSKGGSNSMNNFRTRKNTLYCDYCNFKGHTRETCYKLHGYPPDFKSKKKYNPAGNFAKDS